MNSLQTQCSQCGAGTISTPNHVQCQACDWRRPAAEYILWLTTKLYDEITLWDTIVIASRGDRDHLHEQFAPATESFATNLEQCLHKLKIYVQDYESLRRSSELTDLQRSAMAAFDADLRDFIGCLRLGSSVTAPQSFPNGSDIKASWPMIAKLLHGRTRRDSSEIQCQLLAVLKTRAINRRPVIAVDANTNVARLSGKPFELTAECAAFVSDLIRERGGPARQVDGRRNDAVFRRLPDELQNVICRKSGCGFWLNRKLVDVHD